MLDFVRLCQKYHIPYLEGAGHHHAHAGWLQLSCPRCSPNSGWHLGFAGGTFNCWRCGKLPFRTTLAALLKMPPESIGPIIHEFQTTRPPQTPYGASIPRKGPLVPPRGCGAILGQHRRYLAQRGFDPDTLVQEWGILGTNHLAGIWSWRVIIPICNAGDQVVAYQGRAIQEDATPKYRMTDRDDCLEDPDGLLYGLNKVPGESVIIVEGVTGVWRLGPGAVATFGIDWTRERANLLRRFKRRMILFDPEVLAQKRAVELAEHLSIFPGVTEVISGFPTDPGDLTPRRVARVRALL
jgi:hypothetical protein